MCNKNNKIEAAFEDSRYPVGPSVGDVLTSRELSFPAVTLGRSRTHPTTSCPLSPASQQVTAEKEEEPALELVVLLTRHLRMPPTYIVCGVPGLATGGLGQWLGKGTQGCLLWT